MTSGVFHSIPLDSITVNREARQRKKINGLQELMESIKLGGLIHPIVVTREHILVAGERRLTACRMLGWTSIPPQYTDELEEDELEFIEYEENVRRSDLTWTEQNTARIKMYELRKRRMPEASDAKIAASMGMDPGNLSDEKLVAAERKINPRIEQVATLQTAINTARAAKERRMHSVGIYTVARGNDIYHGSFHDWAPTYSGPKFDVIHCDFPYGINSQSSGINPSGYDDSLAAFNACGNTLVHNLERFCATQAHIIFWFSMSNYAETEVFIRYLRIAGFTFDELPLIWHKSDGRGIAPDPQRRPRRVYETAWFGWRGDHKLVRLKDNLVSTPGAGGTHPHEKNELAMRHFLEMVVDRTTSVLDPTCGSGSALRAAKSLNARHVFGIEQDEQYAEDAAMLLAKVITP